MKLLFFSNVFPNPLNPVCGTFNHALLCALAKSHDVHVVAPLSWVGEAAARLRTGKKVGSRFTQVAGRLTAEFPRYYYPPKILRSEYGRFMWWSVGRRLTERLREFRPDAVVSYWAHPDGEVAVRAAQLAGVPAIVMVGGSDVLLLARQGSRRRAILKVLHDADVVVAVSHDIADRLERDGIPAGKLRVLYRGVERNVFSPGDRGAARARLGLNPDRPTLVAVGRLVPVKGFDLLVDACRQLVERQVPVNCYILGGGPLGGELARQIEEHQLGEIVFLPGPQPHHNLADWYRAADLTVLTSHSEGIPNVLLESICCGTPFVATKVGGVPEIADERGHTLVPAGDASAIATAIEQRLCERPGEAFSPRMLPLSWEESADGLCEIIKSCGGQL